MKKERQKYCPSPNVIDTILSDTEATLIHSQSKLSYSFNKTGTRVWCLLKKGTPLTDIVTRIQKEFEIDLDRAERDVYQFVNALISRQLIEPVSE